jgi:hypothetical protein
MSVIGDKADAIQAPTVAADSTGLYGCWRISGITTAASVAVPARYRNHYLRLKARDADIQIGFSAGAAGATLVLNQASTMGTGHVGAGYTLANGESIDVLVPYDATFLNYIVVSGTGRLEGFVSEARIP